MHRKAVDVQLFRMGGEPGDVFIKVVHGHRKHHTTDDGSFLLIDIDRFILYISGQYSQVRVVLVPLKNSLGNHVLCTGSRDLFDAMNVFGFGLPNHESEKFPYLFKNK